MIYKKWKALDKRYRMIYKKTMDPVLILKLTGLLILAYLLGSIPWGIILTRHIHSKDVRWAGSGNIGATNVRRVAGTKLGLMTLMGDLLKGAVPVWLAIGTTAPDAQWHDIFIAAIVLAAVLGHLYPLFLKLKNGGKGVATAAGCFLAVSPLAFLIALLVFTVFVFWTNTISAGSLAATGILPIPIWFTTHSWPITGCAVIVTVWVYVRHRNNIHRLLSGTENVIRARKSSRD